MRSWKTIAITLIVLVVIIRWSNTWEEKISRTPAPVVKPLASDPPTETTPDERPPAVESSTPKPRIDESRSASRPGFEYPLVISDPSDTHQYRRARDAGPEIEADFDKIHLMLRDYRTLAGENPVGTNAEIMKSVMGDNPKGARLGPPEGGTINEKGELIDRWGKPYFFHQLSKDLMEIHSAGPDGRMGNEDDIVGD